MHLFVYPLQSLPHLGLLLRAERSTRPTEWYMNWLEDLKEKERGRETWKPQIQEVRSLILRRRDRLKISSRPTRFARSAEAIGPWALAEVAIAFFSVVTALLTYLCVFRALVLRSSHDRPRSSRSSLQARLRGQYARHVIPSDPPIAISQSSSVVAESRLEPDRSPFSSRSIGSSTSRVGGSRPGAEHKRSRAESRQHYNQGLIGVEAAKLPFSEPSQHVSLQNVGLECEIPFSHSLWMASAYTVSNLCAQVNPPSAPARQHEGPQAKRFSLRIERHPWRNAKVAHVISSRFPSHATEKLRANLHPPQIKKRGHSGFRYSSSLHNPNVLLFILREESPTKMILSFVRPHTSTYFPSGGDEYYWHSDLITHVSCSKRWSNINRRVKNRVLVSISLAKFLMAALKRPLSVVRIRLFPDLSGLPASCQGDLSRAWTPHPLFRHQYPQVGKDYLHLACLFFEPSMRRMSPARKVASLSGSSRNVHRNSIGEGSVPQYPGSTDPPELASL
ncbi:hypothetical protein BS47DRAFT_1395046 [Hydnum rufescens UP504]|uniref:Uncharacterized protein n=1 Tax=Hydnum rufescens UP504 TaxID=1448309 RepID=A0A9P6ATQ5_9AGAM|nr:hypothetical protein BS47DRAFT_1395046 [Hydnum rufescens UP504]